MKERIVVIAGKLFKVDKTVLEKGKLKFIIHKLGNFYADEVSEAGPKERFLYFMDHYSTRAQARATCGRRPPTDSNGLPGDS